MARLYADEQFPRETVLILRTLGHDVLTVQEAGKANQKIPDEEVLAFAANNQRAVVTLSYQIRVNYPLYAKRLKSRLYKQSPPTRAIK
ncbi:MAG TPA: hypothetical protein DDW76_23225 [Cyanobacteria bacterium UBA11369]|nr:hypothetical protein [Cyanobacteria bacterium UBA11371]HBE51604.1 hypothetical protein [Cyanobacteria bacterium UBA11369]